MEDKSTDSPQNHKDVRKIYCRIKMSGGSAYTGFVYADSAERLQDLLNDDRKFIPVQLMNDLAAPNHKVIGTIILAKQYIVSIEERDFSPLGWVGIPLFQM